MMAMLLVEGSTTGPVGGNGVGWVGEAICVTTLFFVLLGWITSSLFGLVDTLEAALETTDGVALETSEAAWETSEAAFEASEDAAEGVRAAEEAT